MSDQELLREYIDRGSHQAFTELVNRYIHLVYGAALRQVRNPAAADDITQAVFLALSQRADRLRSRTVLVGWLLTATQYAANCALRAEARRKRREEEAAEMAALRSTNPSGDQDDAWNDITPILDEALLSLSVANRDAVVLRYFVGMSDREVAGVLGISEDSAKQRVCRGLARLRGLFQRRGIATTSSMSLGVLLADNAVQQAPAHVISGAAGIAAGASHTAAACTITKELLDTMAWIKAKVLAAWAAGILLVGAGAAIVGQAMVERQHVIVVPSMPATAMQSVGFGYERTVQGPAGIVRASDGRPVANVEILLAAREGWISVYGAANRYLPTTRSGPDGRFSFGPVPTWTHLVARHARGFAHVSSPDRFPADSVIVLQPWGRIQGTVLEGSKPVPGAVVAIDQAMALVPTLDPDNPITYSKRTPGPITFDKEARTDDQGRFVFTRVAPGETAVWRQGSAPYSHRTYTFQVEVAAGNTVNVELGGSGQAVVGRVQSQDTAEKHDYTGFISPTLRLPPVPADWSRLSYAQRQRIISDWAETPDGKRYVSRPQYNVVINSDGTFRADDIPPGNYTLQLDAISRQTIGPISETVAMGRASFIVPVGQQPTTLNPQDLGTIVLSAYPHVCIGQPVPALEYVRGDGSKSSIGDFKGRYLILHFSPPKSGRFADDVQTLQCLWDKFSQDARFRFLALAWAGDAKGPNRPMQPHLANLWEQGDVLAPGTMENYARGIDAGVTTYLVDPEGKAIAKGSARYIYAAADCLLANESRGPAGVDVVTEHKSLDESNSSFIFKSIPGIARNDAGQKAVFSVVAGTPATYAGDLKALNDGQVPTFPKEEFNMFTFMPYTLEGRIRADLGGCIAVGQINSYTWHRNGNRCPQVYRVYGSDGLSQGFDAAPGIGIDPAACGWKLIAQVDTRAVPGGVDLTDGQGGQDGVSIRRSGGPIGKYRYLLFVVFATETRDEWGQTCWSELDIQEHR